MKSIDNPEIKIDKEKLLEVVMGHKTGSDFIIALADYIDAHTAAAVAAEREACAVIAETDTFGNHEYKGADEIAKEIRAR